MILTWLLQVFLKVDTGFSNGELGIKAYVSRSMNIGSLQLGTEFAEITLEAQTTNLQKISSEPASQLLLAPEAKGRYTSDNTDECRRRAGHGQRLQCPRLGIL